MALTRIERKRQLPDATAHETLISRLRDLGYRPFTDRLEIDDYYGRPGATRGTAGCLRMRRRDRCAAEFVYEPGKPDANDSDTGASSQQETKVVLADIDQWHSARRLLRLLGIPHQARVENHRREFRQHRQGECGVVTVAIDAVIGVGQFLDVEVLTTDTDAAKLLLNRVEQQLGSENLPVVTVRYRDLAVRGVLR